MCIRDRGSQGTVCGGGRYDPLFEMFGGKPTPSCGFALGMERLIELLKTQGDVNTTSKADVFIAHQGEDALPEAFVLAESLRNTGLDVIVYCTAANSGGDEYKRQLRGYIGVAMIEVDQDKARSLHLPPYRGLLVVDIRKGFPCLLYTSIGDSEMSEQDLTGKIALVTGASRGIGHAIAMELAAHGAIVIGTATSEAGAQHISQDLATVRPDAGKGIVLNLSLIHICKIVSGNVLKALQQGFGRS